MNSFDVLKLMILKPREFRELPDKIKGQSFFLINRVVAQHLPFVSNSFNKNGIDVVSCLDYYSVWFQNKRYTKIPRWVFSKSAAKHNKKYDKEVLFFLRERGYKKSEIEYIYTLYSAKELKKIASDGTDI